MTQAVPTNGFIAQAGVNQPIVGGEPNIPPQNQEPGFVQPAKPVAPVTAAAESTPDGLQAAIAALTAQLQSTGKPEGVVQAAVPAEAPTGDLNKFDTSTIDDPIMRSMATLMQTVGDGIDMDRALGKAIASGDTSLIDEAYLRDVGGVRAEQLIQVAQGLVQAVEAKSTAITASVHALAGGEAGWTNSVAAFNTGAPQELRMVVAQMLDSRKENMIQAGAKLVLEYAKASGRVPNINPSLQTGAAVLPTGSALDKNGFQEELRKLNPQDRSFQQSRAELFNRRNLGRSLGL